MTRGAVCSNMEHMAAHVRIPDEYLSDFDALRASNEGRSRQKEANIAFREWLNAPANLKKITEYRKQQSKKGKPHHGNISE